ncbi:FkbM family methyltransferase [Lacibacter sediminis]|uniref:FkbM family methyltransferase n=1 Tax=Lacibacter sediminis TaxID=2760713 RepID=A0A7G5XHN8_9BACT|nr:FkbM family methyltransferase [Lacibacter sediminis]QNA44991.1 FkbM family methyltransferase [Lacibacter sediminis]
MNIVKKFIIRTTGYWMHKLSNLPVGADLFVDINHKINYPSLDVIFDVGANVGQTRTYFRFHLPDVRIYSFEPVQATFQQLKNSATGDVNCVLEHMALGDEAGEKAIRLFDSDFAVLNSLREDVMNNAANAREETIKIDTLDHYCSVHNIKKIDLLKIDTEGFEINVLKGAEQMLQGGHISFVYCETGFQQTNQRNTYFPVLTEHLALHGYYFFGLYNTDFHDWKRGNHLANALYIHQSVFPS